jgi:hypothetical protein
MVEEGALHHKQLAQQVYSGNDEQRLKISHLCLLLWLGWPPRHLVRLGAGDWKLSQPATVAAAAATTRGECKRTALTCFQLTLRLLAPRAQVTARGCLTSLGRESVSRPMSRSMSRHRSRHRSERDAPTKEYSRTSDTSAPRSATAAPLLAHRSYRHPAVLHSHCA